MRNTPRSLVTASKVFPEASWMAVIDTPGSTAPVESVTVPLMVASCACAATGSMNSALTTKRRTTREQTDRNMGPPVATKRQKSSDDDPGSVCGHGKCPLSQNDDDRAVLQIPNGGDESDSTRVISCKAYAVPRRCSNALKCLQISTRAATADPDSTRRRASGQCWQARPMSRCPADVRFSP